VRLSRTAVWLWLSLSCAGITLGQSPNAILNGIVFDQEARAIPNAQVLIISDLTGVRYQTVTNSEGIYTFPSVAPGPYRIQVSKLGFKTIVRPDIVLNVQDALSVNFTLPIGAVSETVTVEGGAPLINTTDATVSTVVDRQFAENLPLNGRSFQTLIYLTPGVVLTAPFSSFDGGQFSVNGQRANANYWMVDGVSANFGASAISGPADGAAGALPSFSVMGGTNSLVSVDALQEFRIQTSTFAPEFGRTPGGQISIVTRSGTNQFHGTLFDYLRNDLFDANDWFANVARLAKPKERQNDFGGTFGGTLRKDRTFFFLSYEGLRLRLPQVALTTVPDASFTPGGTTNARAQATLAMQPYFNAFPLPNPNSPEILGPPDRNGVRQPTGSAEFDASYSNQATLDAVSLRIDHHFNGKVSLFGRYNYSPSELVVRGGGSLNTVSPTRIVTQTATIGATWAFSPTMADELRFNYSRNKASSFSYLDDFGGARPLAALPFPSPFTSQDAQFTLLISSLNNGSLSVGRQSENVQRQINIVDDLSTQRGTHSLKFGIDFRRLSPVYHPIGYFQEAFFLDVSSAQTGKLFFSDLASQRNSTLLFRNLGVFAQDTWRLRPRLTLTYGLRWDVDFTPASIDGPALLGVSGFNSTDLSNLAVAPAGTAPFQTAYGNVAPRVGIAYQVRSADKWQTVLRGGFGVFHDLATSQVGNVLSRNYPFGASSFRFRGTFPLDAATAAPPPITPAGLSAGLLYAFNPHLKLPYTLEWNGTIEQALGAKQALSVSYIGASGRRLIQSAFVNAPNANFAAADLIDNTAASSYHALQMQFQRRLSSGLQALASYTWSHSIDDGSTGSYANGSNALVPGLSAKANRGASDFDIRRSFSAAMTWALPNPKEKLLNALLGNWSLHNILLVQSAAPVDIYYLSLRQIDNANTHVRPDVVPGMPLYLSGSQYPGHKAFNPAAFTKPPIDPTTHFPIRQGNLGRNALRGFGATQWDLAVHREFPLHEELKLQFRAELFNVLNHPNFGSPSAAIDRPNFGLTTQMLGQSLSNGLVGAGTLNPLYQIGGPRSVQLALKLIF
jgi:Carboxypeptidase regulatory-like domain/TonB dependent receptor